MTQLETGLQYSHESIGGSPAQKRFSVQLAVRGGLTDNLELGVNGEPLVSLSGADDATNIGALELNAKYVFFDSPVGLGLADAGAAAVREAARWPASRSTPARRISVCRCWPASICRPTSASTSTRASPGIGQSSHAGYLAQAQAALGLARDVSRMVSLFSDLSYASRDEHHGRSSLTLDAGVLWRPTPNVALDASVVTSLVGQGPDWGLRAGVSVRFGR